MDDKFRLVICHSGLTPSGDAFVAKDAEVFDTLWDAIKAGASETSGPGTDVYFVAHKHLVFDPLIIAVLREQLAAKGAADWVKATRRKKPQSEILRTQT